MAYTNDIKAYMPQNEQEKQDKKVFISCLELFPNNILLRDNEIAHITGSGFIVNKTCDKILMIHHNIRNTWAWTGGHADGNGNLLEVAVKEAFEETGLITKPLSNKIASLDILTVLGHTKRGKYVNSHIHLNVSYILIADESRETVVKPDENSAVSWFTEDRINSDLFSSGDVYLYSKLLQRAKSLQIVDNIY